MLLSTSSKIQNGFIEKIFLHKITWKGDFTTGCIDDFFGL